MIRFVAMLAFLAFMIADAAAASPSKDIIKVSASVPIEADDSAPGNQKRTIPWERLTLKATADFNTSIPEKGFTDVSLTPGIWAAGLRLAARDSAMQDLARQLARLPAAEALPGEKSDMNLADFAARRPPVEKQIRELLEREAVESVRRDPSGRSLLALELSLQNLASMVLDQGGGFTPQAAVTSEFGPRARAQSAAMAQVRSDLLRRVLTEPLAKGETIADWVARNQLNRQRVIASIADARITRSEARPAPDGSENWIINVEYDLARFKKAILDEEKKTREYQKKLKSSAQKQAGSKATK